MPAVVRQLALVTTVCCALAACSESAPSDAGKANGGAATAGANAAGTNATSGAATTLGGSAGATTGGSSGGAVPTAGVGTGGVGGLAGAAGVGGTAGAGNGACPNGALICDDFEKYQDGATDLSPDWIAYTYSGSVKVDSTKPRTGKQSLHLNTQQGMRHYADIIRETRGQQLLPLKHFGRLMLWLAAIPPNSHWNINLSSGPLVGAPDEIGKFAEGGMFGKLMSNYAQRSRAKAGDQYLLRGGGPEQGDAAADADCAVAAPQQTIAAGKWVCWEWEFDGTSNSAHLWLDGAPMTEVDAVGHGTQCQGPGFMGKPMSASYEWQGPQLFDKVIVGYEQYQDTPAQEVWIDDLALGAERQTCPPPL
jgi:hypothetical protein